MKKLFLFISLLCGLTACLFGGAYPLSEGFNGQTVQVSQGQWVQLTLPGDPEADQEWLLEPVDPTILAPKGEPRYDAASLAGGTGRYIWEFESVAAGTTPLRLQRIGAPAWEAQGPFEVTIEVTHE